MMGGTELALETRTSGQADVSVSASADLFRHVMAGARLYYHGDYDWPGIAIGNFVMRTWQALPWRFGTIEYRAAVAQTPSRPRDLGVARVEASWDTELAAVMDEYGLIVAEEAVVASLLQDLHQDVGT